MKDDMKETDPPVERSGPETWASWTPARRPGPDGAEFWTRMERRGPDEVVVAGVPVRAGSRVRLRPSAGRSDVLDLLLDGRTAVVESVEQDDEGAFHVAVVLDEDPGRDLGEARMPGHRFFYTAQEIEPLGPAAGPPGARVLVAGLGNIFLGDDGFGVEVVRLLAGTELPGGVDVTDFGIRGMDLVYALQRDYDLAILVDAAPRGEPPGTLTVLEADTPDSAASLGETSVETHGMDPVRVLRLARELGRVPDRVIVVCCEPATVLTGGADEDVLVDLSEPVRAATGQAVRLVMDMIAESAGPGSRPQNPE
ncbi:hydrogenase maturation protease [Nonomuraea indica]|uniref:hydrogenase maturation protease n=1 Tax=Nonomuraea indica TaxID=1581193 RepID=UPI001FE70BC5|nr:hydrogenase maturation protease [Nonomuraea indica]